MATAIIIQNSASDDSVRARALELQNFGINDVIAIGQPSLKGGDGIQSFISLGSISLGSAIRQAALIAKSHTIVFIDARGESSYEGMREVFETGHDSVFAMQGDAELLPQFSPERLVQTISEQKDWPMAVILTTKTTLRSMPDLMGEESSDVLAQMAQIAASRGVTMKMFGSSLEEQDGEMTVSRKTQARMLQLALSNYTLEQLFQALESGKQTMSDAYNVLAAQFIRFGDTTSALECLDGADTSNPRVLALKGMIAHARGETLGAVANMVSSLQQYETAKDMLSIPSTNLDSINGQLRAGLEALNNKQNDQALAYFADAVFQVDSFYRQAGIGQKVVEQ